MTEMPDVDLTQIRPPFEITSRETLEPLAVVLSIMVPARLMTCCAPVVFKVKIGFEFVGVTAKIKGSIRLTVPVAKIVTLVPALIAFWISAVVMVTEPELAKAELRDPPVDPRAAPEEMVILTGSTNHVVANTETPEIPIETAEVST